jgi:hypothetical protein
MKVQNVSYSGANGASRNMLPGTVKSERGKTDGPNEVVATESKIGKRED